MRNLFWGMVLILLGLLFLLNNMGISDSGEVIRMYWPVILILWGISALFRKRQNTAINIDVEPTHFEQDLLHRSNVFGDISINIDSSNFKGGSISNVLGDCDVDLAKSILAEGEHLMRIHTIFGDTRILLPKECAVSVTASVLLGDLKILGQSIEGFSKDIHLTTPDYQTAQKRLALSITHIFGSVKIIQQ
jgi:predicted membrane protein